jgi:uncharacterized protein with PQ loop repeat
MKKLVFFISAVFLALGPSSALASETQLTWERSQMQQVEIDPAIAQSITVLSLIGQGQSLQFTPSVQRSEENRYIYQSLIPISFPLGTYVVQAVLTDGTFKDLSLIRVVEYQSQSYNPLLDTETVAILSVTFFTLLTMWGIADSQPGRRDEYEGNQTTFDGADGGSLGRGASDRRAFRKGLISSINLDQMRSVWTITSNRFSPLFSRLISDSGYLQFSLGAAVLVLPILGALLGALAFQDIKGVGGITTPSFAITAAIIILGAFDAGAAFIASIIFGLCALTSQRFGNVYDIRTYLGMSLLWFAPSLIANATRALRKSRKDSDWWERLTDVFVGSLITGWAVRCMVIGLDGYAHLKLPLSVHASSLGFVAGIAIAIRYLTEGYVNQKNHYYLAYLSPRNLNQLDPNFRLIGWFIKALLFLFFAVSFLGLTWQLWVALTLLMLPQLIKTVKDKFPNSASLFQILPVGIPAAVFMTLLGKFYSNYIQTLNLDPASASRTIFVLAPIPGFIIGLLKFFGREARPGDKRWYMRSNRKLIYRAGGVFLFSIYVGLTVGLVG